LPVEEQAASNNSVSKTTVLFLLLLLLLTFYGKIPKNRKLFINTKTARTDSWGNNSGIKPPLPVVDPQRFYRSGESQKALEKIRNTKLEIRNKS